MQEKIIFHGVIRSVQPRSNVWRYRLDNRTHGTTGYNLFIAGNANGREGSFAVAISEKQQEKHGFRIGDGVSGTAWTKLHPQAEFADYYRAGALKRLPVGKYEEGNGSGPWKGAVPPLSVYDQRGCRMLDRALWRGKCFQCIWAAMGNVAIEYEWGVRQKFRFESFCYGPKSCPLYKMGKPRAVPYYGCGDDYDDGCLDEILTDRRGYDE